MRYPKEWPGVIDTVGCGEWCKEHPPGEMFELIDIQKSKIFGGGACVKMRRIYDNDRRFAVSLSALDELKPLTPTAAAMLKAARHT